MIVTNAWHNMEFHDAIVRGMVWTGSRLSIDLVDLYLLPDRPSASGQTPLRIPQAVLTFETPTSVTARAYQSATGEWQDIAVSDFSMNTIAEVIVQDATMWKITGFAADGRWLELRVRLGGDVLLQPTDESN